MNRAEPLGKKLNIYAVTLRRKLSAEQWKTLAETLPGAIGMKPAAAAKMWSYPTDGGEGGTGETIVQPITESFVAIDTWPDHCGAYLVVCSCREFSINALIDFLKRHEISVGHSVDKVLELRGEYV